MPLKLQIKIITKKIGISLETLFGEFIVTFLEKLGDFTLGTARSDNQTFVVLDQCFPVQPRFVVKALEVSNAGEFEQVVVTR